MAMIIIINCFYFVVWYRQVVLVFILSITSLIIYFIDASRLVNWNWPRPSLFRFWVIGAGHILHLPVSIRSPTSLLPPLTHSSSQPCSFFSSFLYRHPHMGNFWADSMPDFSKWQNFLIFSIRKIAYIGGKLEFFFMYYSKTKIWSNGKFRVMRGRRGCPMFMFHTYMQKYLCKK